MHACRSQAVIPRNHLKFDKLGQKQAGLAAADIILLGQVAAGKRYCAS